MTLYVNVQNLTKSYGSKTLFENLSFSVFHKQKIGLIGPNGSGKSTLLKILVNEESADTGEVLCKRNLKIGYVPQVSDFPDLPSLNFLLKEMEPFSMDEHEKLYLAKLWLSKVGFQNIDASAAFLSGGWKKRLSIAKAMLFSPDVLLLDEPTNHLDLEGILWLEDFLSKELSTYVLISHDRHFLRKATNRVIEINTSYPKGVFSIDGPYSEFLLRKKEFLEGQQQQERSVASKARRETEWLGQNAKARTTKAQSRIDGAYEILKEFEQIKERNREKKTGLSFEATERETRKLLVAKNVSKKIGEKVLFEHLNFTLSPGTRIGLVGPNGCGKTTLLKLLAGELEPDLGTLKKADGLKIVYFDQHRMALPHDITLREALSPNGDFVYFKGQHIHVNGWCKRFLFSPDFLDMPVGKLSGGEKARISIAHLMLQPADILLLDEPANDLDIPTLETLEANLEDFPGSIVLITHDREMLVKICNSFLPLGDLSVTEPLADYKSWESSFQTCSKSKNTLEEKNEKIPLKEAAKSKKLTYAEKKEYDQMETKIEKLEKEAEQLNQILSSTSPQDVSKVHKICSELEVLHKTIENLYRRWEELENKHGTN